MSQYWRENAFVFVPSSYINVKWQNRSNTPLLYIQYTPPPSMYCVLAPFYIKQCHEQPCCNSNFISTKHLPPIAEAVRVECT